MRLVQAQIILDKINARPKKTTTTTFGEHDEKSSVMGYLLAIQYIEQSDSYRAYLHQNGTPEPYRYDYEFDGDKTPDEVITGLAEWLTFVVNMTLCINDLVKTQNTKAPNEG